MATEAELAILDALLTGQEKEVREAFLLFVRTFRSEELIAAITEKIQNNDIEGALLIVDSHVALMGNIMPAVSAAAGRHTAAELAGILPDVEVAVHFDPTHPRAAELIRRNRLRFVVEFSADQRRAVQQALQRAYMTGLGTQETARSFRNAIGLTAFQEQAVQNYRRALESLDAGALSRQLRDRRFDGTVGRAIENNRPLTPAQVDRMTERYRDRWLAMRAETIARTEGVRATSQAREESVAQMLEQTGIQPGRVKRIWNPTLDKRTRDFHLSMRGQERAIGEAFVDGHGNRVMFPGDPRAPAETVINCRCVLTTRVI